MAALRMFVAVVPPPEAVAPLAQAVAGQRDRAGLRWAVAGQWHVTLVFLAAVDPAAVEALVARLRVVGERTPALRLRVAGAGAFPRPRRARVLWAGVDGDAEALAALAGDCREAAVASGIDVGDTRFRAHVTLARARRATVDVGGLSDVGGPPWTAGEIHLVQSRLGAGEGGRSVHETVASLPLTG